MHSLESFVRDLHYAIRQLTRSRGFALMAILTLALGIGANSAIFSIVEAVLLRPLPYQHPERLVVVWQTDAAHHDSGAYFNSYREFEVWRQHSRSFEKLAALTWATGPRTLLWQGKPLDVLTIPASVDFFSMLGESAQIGRTFAPRTSRAAALSFLPTTSGRANWARPLTLWAGASLSVMLPAWSPASCRKHSPSIQ